MIQWQPPVEDHRNGKIIGYLVRYRLNGYGDGSPWSYRNITVEVYLFHVLLRNILHPLTEFDLIQSSFDVVVVANAESKKLSD